MPCFQTLMTLGNKAPALCLWCFDLLLLDGVRLMPLPLVERKAILASLVKRIGDKPSSSRWRVLAAVTMALLAAKSLIGKAMALFWRRPNAGSH